MSINTKSFSSIFFYKYFKTWNLPGKVPTVISLTPIVQTSLYNQTVVLRIPVF